MSLTYGYDLKSGDKILEAPVRTNKIMSGLILPGASLVNHISFCAPSNFPVHGSSISRLFSVRYIPSWVPYISYEPVARIVGKLSVRIRNEPIDFVKNALVCDDYAPDLHV